LKSNNFKKAQASLETVVFLIAGILFLVVVLYMILGSGLLLNFSSQTNYFLCTISSSLRGVIVNVILSVWRVVGFVLSIYLNLTLGFSGVKSLTSSAVKTVLKKVIIVGLPLLDAALFALDISIIVVYMVIMPTLNTIPLLCSTDAVNIGDIDKPSDLNYFFNRVSSVTSDCYNMYGAGHFDPLFGLDPPNPRLCTVIRFNLEQKTDASTLYTQMANFQKSNFALKDKIFLYCSSKGGSFYFAELNSTMPDSWKDCGFKKGTLNIMYLDKHDYDLFSYGTGVCNGAIDVDDMDLTGENDAIVWCVESEE